MLYSVDHIDFNHNEMEFYKFAIVPINKLDGLHKKAIFNYSKDLINNDVSLNFNTKEPLEFIDNSEKVFISVHSSIFHFVVDSLQTIIYHYRYNNNTKFIIDCSEIKNNIELHKEFFGVLKEFLNFLKIDYHFVDSSLCDIILNNVFYYSHFPKTEVYLRDLIKVLKDCYEIDSSIVPNKKIYTSRSIIDMDRLNEKKIYSKISKYDSDIRLENEEILKDFLIKKSFHIIDFENISFKDRLNLLNETKLISGVTGSGLLGQLFMQEGQTVVEYVTMLRDGLNLNGFQLHQHYNAVSYIKKHFYMGVYNDRNAHNLIKTIKNNKTLMALINE